MQARLDSNRFDLGSVVKTLPAAAAYDVAGDAEIHADLRVELPHLVLVPLSGGGRPGAQMQMKVEGPHLEADGTVRLSGVTFRPEGGAIPAVANLTGNIRLTSNGAVIEPTSFDLGSGHAKLQAEASTRLTRSRASSASATTCSSLPRSFRREKQTIQKTFISCRRAERWAEHWRRRR